MTTETQELTHESVAEDKTIIIVTTDKLGSTGSVTWQFLFAENRDRSKVVPDEVQSIACGLPFGYLWVPENERRRPAEEQSRPFNIFEAGKGLLVGGGFEPFKDRSNDPFRRPGEEYSVEADRKRHRDWQQEMLDNIPACFILMQSDDYEWLMDHILRESGRSHVRYHCDQPLFTS